MRENESELDFSLILEKKEEEEDEETRD